MKREFALRYGDLQRWHWWFEGRRRILARILGKDAQVADARGWTIASIGSGPPENLDWLLPFALPRGRVVGVDRDPANVLRAKGKVQEKIFFVIGRAEAPPLRRGVFDRVLALDILEHLDDDRAALREAAALTAPEGYLVVTVPALPLLFGRNDLANEHRRRYTRATLASLFERSGVAEVRIRYFNFFLFPPIALARLLDRILGRDLRPKSSFDGSSPGALNSLLAFLFSLERFFLDRGGFPIGVSLLATAPDETRP